jgi:hypothetical protein
MSSLLMSNLVKEAPPYSNFAFAKTAPLDNPTPSANIGRM